jgi:hypothetical protein
VFLADRQVVADPSGAVIFDALATEENLAPQRISYYNPVGDLRHYAGAWHGNKNEGQSDALLVGAKLQFITDGLSSTILVGEQAGVPKRYEGGTTPDKVISEGSHSWFFWSYDETDFGIVLSHARSRVINWQNRQGIFAFHRGAHAAFCDGAVRFLDEGTEPQVLAAWLVRNDNGNIMLLGGQ